MSPLFNMTQREQDIQIVCRGVLHHAIKWEHYPNSWDRYRCVFCGAEVPDNDDFNEDEWNEKFPHNLHCPVLIAKDLMTNLENT